MKKGILVIIVAALCFVPLSVFAKGQSESSQGTAKNGTVTFSAYVPGYANIKDFNTNWFTLHVEKMFNMKINFIVGPTSNSRDKVLLLLASGDYPDVFLEGDFSANDIMKYGVQQKIFIPLNSLIKQSGPNITAAWKEVSYLKQDMIAPNGNIYSVPKVNECFHCFWGQKYWINVSWLKKLGLQMPKTTAEFEKVLMAFKTRDPNGDGKHDEIPLTGSAYNSGWHTWIPGFLMNAFIYDNETNYFTVNSGVVSFAPDQPQWRQGLAYIHSLWANGLIDPGAFTQNDDAKNRLANQTPNIVGAFADGAYNDVFSIAPGQTRQLEYHAVPPLTGPNGVQLAGYYAGLGSTNFNFTITTKATKAQAVKAMELANYMYSTSGAQRAEFGPEGKYWRPAKKGELDFYGKQARVWDNNAAFYSGNVIQNVSWPEVGPLLRTARFRETEAVPQNPYAQGGDQLRLWLETKNKYAGHQPKEVYPDVVYLNPNVVDEASRLRTQINDYVRQWEVAFITGTKNINTDWSSYITGLHNLGLKRYLEVYQNAIGH